uniref:EB domain-containing protein n=1 Tax=Steinernema glaseri TaxID=37863 RepID=A0A1I8AJQ1_9BILA
MCNATRRCVNETFLLESATKECGQRIENHTFEQSCGIGHFFAIDYTCCAPYKYHEECVRVPVLDETDKHKYVDLTNKTVEMAKDGEIGLQEW